MARSSSNQYLKAGVIVLILGLLGLNIYQYVNNSKLEDVNKQQKQELIEKVQLYAELEQDFTEAKSELEEMKGANEELNAKIDLQLEELAEQKERIKHLLRDSKNLKRARADLAKLKEQAASFIAEIEALKQENEMLTNENQNLQQKTVVLIRTVHVKDSINAELNEAKAQVEEEKQKVESEKEVLSLKYSKASAIPVAKIKAAGYEVKKNGKSARRYWAKNTDYVKICLTPGHNPSAEPGDEAYYIRIINPNGQVMTLAEAGSGMLTNNDTGDEIPYSYKTDWQYGGADSQLCTQWNPGEQFMKGNYIVEVYNHGYLVGKDHFKLR